MAKSYKKNYKTADQARNEAQKIAFAPLMFQAAKALRDFGILAHLTDCQNGDTLQNIAREIKISEYGAQVLLEAGLSMDLVMVKENRYYLSKVGYFMNSDPMVKKSMDFTHFVNYKAAYHLQESVKNGRPEGLENEYGSWNSVYEALPDMSTEFRDIWFSFNQFYSDATYAQALPIIFKSNPYKILDIGGNSGRFAIECAQYNQDVKITILDLPGQLKDAKLNIRKEGLEDRITCSPINLLDFSKSYPKGFDIIWMSQFLDCFADEVVIRILSKVKEIMDDYTTLFIMEPLWDKQQEDASVYSLHATSLYFTCMANGNSRMYHSEDLFRLIESINLKIVECHHDIGISHTIIHCSI